MADSMSLYPVTPTPLHILCFLFSSQMMCVGKVFSFTKHSFNMKTELYIYRTIKDDENIEHHFPCFVVCCSACSFPWSISTSLTESAEQQAAIVLLQYFT